MLYCAVRDASLCLFVCLLGLFVASRHYRALKRCAACCRCANGYSVAVAFAAHVRVRCEPRLQEISALNVIKPRFGAHYALDELLQCDALALQAASNAHIEWSGVEWS